MSVANVASAPGAPMLAERARRIAVIAGVVNGELLLREAADELGVSVPHVCNIKRAWNTGAGDTAVPAPQTRRRRPPPRPTRAARSRHAMTDRLARPAGRSLYRQRQAVIEPIFGDIKTNRRITRFLRRGHSLVRAEWHLDAHRPQPDHPPRSQRLSPDPPGQQPQARVTRQPSHTPRRPSPPLPHLLNPPQTPKPRYRNSLCAA